jgi:DNA-binding response OmpR family regulator
MRSVRMQRPVEDHQAPRETVLLVDDDPAIERTMRKPLDEWGYELLWASCAAEARSLARQSDPDLIILDLMLPDGDGLLLTPSLQKATGAAVLICSARDRQVDRVLSLKLGAADFIAKPFDLDELEARIKVLMRRVRGNPPRHGPEADQIRVGDITITPRRASVRIGDQQIHLTPTEYRLLTVLASDPESVFDRRSLSKRVWGYDDLTAKHLVDVHIGRLRAKLNSVPTEKPYLVTVRGRGFRLVGQGQRDANEMPPSGTGSHRRLA